MIKLMCALCDWILQKPSSFGTCKFWYNFVAFKAVEHYFYYISNKVNLLPLAVQQNFNSKQLYLEESSKRKAFANPVT